MTRIQTWPKLGLLIFSLCFAVLTISASTPTLEAGPLIIAHRGASVSAPENTMAAFEKAVQLGADFIELDVRMSKDGEPVVIHDKTVDRTTNETGFVQDYTLRQLQGMDAGSNFRAGYAQESIATLREVLERFAGRIGILIEIKDPKLYPGIAEKVAGVVRQHGSPRIRVSQDTETTAGIMIQSFDYGALRRVHAMLPHIPVAALIAEDQQPLSDKMLDKLTSYASYINYSHARLTRKIVRDIHSRNRKVMAWTLQNNRDTKRMRKLGVDGMITDNLN